METIKFRKRLSASHKKNISRALKDKKSRKKRKLNTRQKLGIAGLGAVAGGLVAAKTAKSFSGGRNPLRNLGKRSKESLSNLSLRVTGQGKTMKNDIPSNLQDTILNDLLSNKPLDQKTSITVDVPSFPVKGKKKRIKRF